MLVRCFRCRRQLSVSRLLLNFMQRIRMRIQQSKRRNRLRTLENAVAKQFAHSPCRVLPARRH